jgi:hypothetical protein
MVQGLRSPQRIDTELLHTYAATRWQAFWLLRLPAALPFLLPSLRVAVAAGLVGAMVAELPTGAQAGLGARLLTGSYYGNTVGIWSALVMSALLGLVLTGAVAGIERQVAALGYTAVTQEQFKDKIANFYIYHTGFGTNILLMTIISFIVGLSISGQTFYSFILENLEKFGALKAIGAKGRDLVLMILFMATFTALTGFGLGIGLVTLMISITRARLPNYAAMITFWNLGLAFGMVVVIAAISSYFGVRKVLKIEPFDIFRG